jgi:hypothetical protein
MGDGPAASACREDVTSDLDVKPETYYLGTRDEMLGFIPEGVDTAIGLNSVRLRSGIQFSVHA